MSCSPFDLKDYFLNELNPGQAAQVEQHTRGCAACRAELDRLRLTEAALFALRDEEIPRRIGFVSDQVFEPSPWRRWWTAFWNSAPRLGFASAAMLTAAILFSALTRPAPAPVAQVASVTPAITQADLQKQIAVAVQKAVAESERQQAKRTESMVANFLEEDRRNRTQLLQTAEALRYFENRNQTLTATMSRSYSGGLQ
jgi:anti-sigma factor RsiW